MMSLKNTTQFDDSIQRGLNRNSKTIRGNFMDDLRMKAKLWKIKARMIEKEYKDE